MLRSFFTPEVFTDALERLRLCAEAAGDRKGDFYNLMGKVCLHNKDYEEAFAYYRKAEQYGRPREPLFSLPVAHGRQ